MEKVKMLKSIEECRVEMGRFSLGKGKPPPQAGAS